MDTPLSSADASFIGGYDDLSGKSVSSAGDVNGDGYDDFLIGARLNDEGGECAGQTYLILGKPSGWSMDTPLDSSDASFIGEWANDWSGDPVSSAGDVNGDGYDDFLIGAVKNDEGGSEAGQTYLILGKPTGWSMGAPLALSDASFIGEAEGDQSGLGVSSAGDVNGDGYDDILIGAHGSDEGGDGAGQTYLILGKPLGWSTDTPLSLADGSFIGEAAGDVSGISVSSAGDVNGDGYNDILIGAQGSDEGGDGAGQTYVILGKPTGWSMDTPLALSDASFIGEASDDQSGSSVSSAGDVNGDDHDDILIGAPYKGWGKGWSYLIFGKPSGWRIDTPLSLADASFIGEEFHDRSGCSVSSAGEVNGDDYVDILIGAYGNDEGGTGAGQTYLNLGGCVGVGVQVTPDTTQVQRGEDLWFTVDLVNSTDSTLTFDAWVDAYLLSGNAYGENPVLGPVGLTLGSGSGIYGVRRYVTIPEEAPYGEPYWLSVRAGRHPNRMLVQDYFEFAIVPPSVE